MLCLGFLYIASANQEEGEEQKDNEQVGEASGECMNMSKLENIEQWPHSYRFIEQRLL